MLNGDFQKAGVNMKTYLKSISLVLLSILVILNFSGCIIFNDVENKTILDLPNYVSKDMYSNGGWQDILIFNKYYYDNVDTDTLDNGKYLQEITVYNIGKVKNYVKEYEGWIECSSDETKEHYDFDKSMIQKGDYYYIEDDRPDIEAFNVYYFDVESQHLYYMHIKW